MNKNFCEKIFKNNSISKEYSLYSSIIIVLIIIICIGVGWQHYRLYLSSVKEDLKLSANHLEVDLTDMFDKTKQMMIYLGTQITKENNSDPAVIDRIFRSAISLEHKIFPILTWSGFDWVNTKNLQVVNTQGVLKQLRWFQYNAH